MVPVEAAIFCKKQNKKNQRKNSTKRHTRTKRRHFKDVTIRFCFLFTFVFLKFEKKNVNGNVFGFQM